MSVQTDTSTAHIANGLESTLANIDAAYRQYPSPSAAERIDRLDRLHHAMLANREELIAAVDADFGGRASAETMLIEFFPILEGIHHNKKHLKKWMRTSPRRTPRTLVGARAEVHYQPLGVVGIVVPWNFPIFLGLSPLVGAFAAGNRAMIKTSEFAPRTGAIVEQMLADSFSDEEVVVINGGVDVATEFTRLPFDHLVFTGSTQVGRIVMHAAADNLTPVTLELGGKSPAIVHPSFPIEEAAKRLAFGKGLNAGQVCVSPDYVLVPSGKVVAFVDAFSARFAEHYPTLQDNADYTSIITERQRDRLLDNVRDAEEKGAQVTRVNPAGDGFDQGRKLPMHVVTGATDDMRIMREEIFGPILPVVPYDTLDDALTYVNDRDRPLALYYFDWDKKRASDVIEATHSGGVCVNDVMSQTLIDDMPFGGVGPSGMGHYHGHEGFLNFSKAKGVVRKGRIDLNGVIGAPWGNRWYERLVAYRLRRFSKAA